LIFFGRPDLIRASMGAAKALPLRADGRFEPGHDDHVNQPARED
jgi:hypothetical protein